MLAISRRSPGQDMWWDHRGVRIEDAPPRPDGRRPFVDQSGMRDPCAVAPMVAEKKEDDLARLASWLRRGPKPDFTRTAY